MTIHYNKTSEKSNRRKLRQKSTEAENILWEYLRNKKLLGLKFKRQYSVDQFVIDFYCPGKKLAVELDGDIHLNKEIKIHDENRDTYLKDFGIKILRISNDLVFENIDLVLKLITNKLTSPPTPP